MIKRYRRYQRILLASVCIALLSLVLSLFSVVMHYYSMHTMYQSIVNEEQNTILEKIEGLTIKEALEKGYGKEIGLLLEPVNTNLPAVSKIEQIKSIQNYAWLSGYTALLVIIILLFVYWFLRRKIISSVKKDVDLMLSRVRQVINSVDFKDKDTLIDIIPLLAETMGYKSLGVWVRKALVKDDVSNTP
ncbi:MAG: hypothetical protein KDD37_04905 [Bdellovibrionales bacterium]|nr:hypothetical protein [Bdellovibrionales bacterium]